MKDKFSIVTLLFFISIPLFYAQVKIGEHASTIHPSSILELESIDKVLVISRMAEAQMNALTPLKGALVYNTDKNCVFVFDGVFWENLCKVGINVTTATSPPINNNLGDFWINTAQNNAPYIWDGTQWVSVDNSPQKGAGIPNTTTAPTPLSGDIYVDTLTGTIYAYDGTTWVNATTINATNGLFINSNHTIELGGILIKPTTIETTAIHTLAIQGLQEGNVLEDAVVSVHKTNGQLRKINSSNLFKEEVAVITAAEGQLRFTPPLTIDDSKKVNVYRNGVRIDFSVVDNTTIEIESEAICYAGDEIRIVQFY